jgi:hypothetical protein
VAGGDEAHPSRAQKTSQKRWKRLITLQFQSVTLAATFLDSLKSNHYGPRGF